MKPQILMFMFSPLDNVPPVINEGTSLAQNGYIVRVLGLRYRKNQSKIEEVAPGFFIHRMSLLTRLLFGESDTFQTLRYAEVAVRSFFWGLFHSSALIIGHDLVTLPYVYPLAKLKRKPVAYRAHELWAEQSADFPLAVFWKKLDAFFSPRVDALVTPEINRAKIYSAEFGMKTFPTVIYNTSAYIQKPEKSPLRERLSAKGISGTYIVYYQGGVGPTRSTDMLVEAMKYLPDEIVLVLLGKTAPGFEQWLNDYVTKNNLTKRVTYLGFLNHGRQLFELCSGGDVGVIFVKADCRSYEFSATAANKLFEYMMMGLPVLATNLESYKQIVEAEHIGLCVDSTNPKRIAEGILYLYNHPEESRKMKETALRLSAERYNWEHEFPKLLTLYQGLLQ